MQEDPYENYQRYRIPPDFDLVDLHAQASLPYAQEAKYLEPCPCCGKYRRLDRIPFCRDSSELTILGEQIPLYFYFLKATSIFLIFLVIAKIGDYQFCQLLQDDQCNLIYGQIQIPSFGKLQIPTGYEQKNQVLNFIEFCIFTLAIFVLKVFIKMRKYQVKSETQTGIGNRTIKLVNVHKKCTVEEIEQIMKPYVVEVVLTYKVRQLQQCLQNINKLLKVKKIQRQDNTASKQLLDDLNYQLQEEKKTLKKIKRELVQQKNRLSVAFVIFRSIAQKQQAFKQFKTSFIRRLFYKVCSCCSKLSIRGQNVTVKSADSPTDIEWKNLQNPYLRTKFRRLISMFVCVVLLFFGLGSEYLFTDFAKQQPVSGPLIRTGITLVLNFIIMILLQYTTQQIENYQSHTTRHLTLVKKLTAFLFINISLSPILGYYLNARGENDQKISFLLSQLAFSILLISIGNIFKPIPTWLSIERLSKAYSKYAQRRKGKKSVMTQIQANKQFQPVQFPISVYYALSLSSLLMVCFYSNIFQILILVELLALVMLYLVSKWMLLRVCKSPAGLARRINNLAQSLLRLMILIYWLGTTILFYLMVEEDNYDNVFAYLIRNQYSYIQMGIVFATTFFMEYLVAWVAKFILGKMHERQAQFQQQSPLLDIIQSQEEDDKSVNNYRNANLHNKLEDQCRKFQKSQIF